MKEKQESKKIYKNRGHYDCMMKKIIIIWSMIFLFICGVFLFFYYQNTITGRAISSEYVQTKAICNDTNFCQDYIITCDNSTIRNMEPITGAVIQHQDDWKDPRENKNLCG